MDANTESAMVIVVAAAALTGAIPPVCFGIAPYLQAAISRVAAPPDPDGPYTEGGESIDGSLCRHQKNDDRPQETEERLPCQCRKEVHISYSVAGDFGVQASARTLSACRAFKQRSGRLSAGRRDTCLAPS